MILIKTFIEVRKLRNLLKSISIITCLLLLIVLLGGALVTKTNSGTGCGSDWPLCHGSIIPNTFNIHTFIEYTHRVSVGLTSIFVFILAILSFLYYKERKIIIFLSFSSVIFLIIQAFFGAAAVIYGQSSFVLALHFGISLLSFTSVVLLTIILFEIDKKFDANNLILDKIMKFQIYGIGLYLFLVIYSGALVRHTEAGLACLKFPYCNDLHIPYSISQMIQMSHRLAAFIIFIWIGLATIHAIKHYSNQRVIYWGFILAFLLVSLQAITGILSVFSNLFIVITLMHSLFISCLFVLFSYFVFLAIRSS